MDRRFFVSLVKKYSGKRNFTEVEKLVWKKTQKLPVLKTNVKELILGCDFNQPIEQALKDKKFKKLKILKFSNEKKIVNTTAFYSTFSQSLNELPNNLKALYLPLYYERVVHKIPKNLKLLEFGNNMNIPFDILLQAKKLKTLGLPTNRYGLMYPYLEKFSKLKILKIPNTETSVTELYKNLFVKLPPNLKELIIGRYSGPEIFPKLPDGIIKLKINHSFQTLKIASLPSNLEVLVLYADLQEFPNCLPKKLKTLILKNTFFNKEINKLPINTRMLSIPERFDQPLDFLRNKNRLKTLKLTCSDFAGRTTDFWYNHVLDEVFEVATSLEFLKLDRCLVYPIYTLPPNLKILKLGKYFKGKIHEIPKSLVIIKIHKDNSQFAKIVQEFLEMENVKFITKKKKNYWKLKVK